MSGKTTMSSTCQAFPSKGTSSRMRFRENVHFVYLLCRWVGKIYALVELLRRVYASVHLWASTRRGRFQVSDGYICDWKNKTQYTLAEHIERLIGNVRSKLSSYNGVAFPRHRQQIKVAKRDLFYSISPRSSGP